MSAFLDDANADFTDVWILNELYDALTQLYERAVVNSREGYWLKYDVRAVTQGTARFRMPKRAVTGGLHRVEVSYDSQTSWCLLEQVDEAQAVNYELGAGQQGEPVRYVVRGDEIVLLPTPNNSTYVLRIFYYLKPNRITPAQAVNNGFVTGVDNVAKTLTVSAAVSSYDTSSVATSMTAGQWPIDVISNAGIAQYDLLTSGWHEVLLNSQTCTISASGLTITFPAAADLSNVTFGDVVRNAGQTDWPCLPADFHRTLADAAAVKILRMRSFDQKADVLEATLAQDLSRFGDLLKPRVQTSAKPIVAPRLYRGQRRNWLVKYP